MRQRADKVAETRRRIVAAAASLHGTVGPAATTITAIAEAAGVTRLTVYRHFPDDEALFAACSAHWAAGQKLPDPQAWQAISDPLERLGFALADLYRFYRDAEPMLTNAERDQAAMPQSLRQGSADAEAEQTDLLLRPFGVRGARHRRLRAVLGHAISFSTWRSLCHDQGLADAEAVDLMAALAATAASAWKLERAA